MYTCRDCLFVCTCTLRKGGEEIDIRWYMYDTQRQGKGEAERKTNLCKYMYHTCTVYTEREREAECLFLIPPSPTG